jgi:alpha-mannosidase
LQVFEDKPMRYEAWDIDIYYQQKMREVTNLKSIQVTEAGSVRAVVRFEWSYMDSTVSQDMVLYADNRRIDFETVVDWHEQQQLLKVAFPVDIRATEATYDIQFGNVTRPTHWNTSWDIARFETVGHQWVDLSEQGYGVSLLNNCKYGHDIKNNVIRLSLIKSALHPDVNADQGKHEFSYSLLPHVGTWVEGETVQEAWALNNPSTYFQGTAQQSEFALFRLSVDNVQIDAVKKAEDTNQIVIRVHEFTGARCNVRLESDLFIKSWQECDLVERMTGKKSEKNLIQFNIKPYEIKTFVVDLARV